MHGSAVADLRLCCSHVQQIGFLTNRLISEIYLPLSLKWHSVPCLQYFIPVIRQIKKMTSEWACYWTDTFLIVINNTLGVSQNPGGGGGGGGGGACWSVVYRCVDKKTMRMRKGTFFSSWAVHSAVII